VGLSFSNMHMIPFSSRMKVLLMNDKLKFLVYLFECLDFR
jgi:hypothetical protein